MALQVSLTVTAAAAAGATLTLPAPGTGMRQRIQFLEITLYSSTARTGVATPIVVTSTNLPGNLAFTFATAAALGAADTRTYIFATPLDAAAQNTAVTIVCPAVTGGMWRINCVYRNEEL